MSYPEKITDLSPSELVSPPVITIDYEFLKGCPFEVIDAVHALVDAYEGVGGGVVPREQIVAYRRPLAGEELDRALLKAQQEWTRLSERYDRAQEDPSQFDFLLLGEINAWAIRENKTPIASTGSGF